MRDTLRGADLLVTGATGFLGKVWLVMLLDRLPEVGRVTIVIRGRRGESAASRFRRIADCSPAFRPLRAKHGAGLAAFLEDHVRVLEGDVTRPLCGLDEAGLALAGRADAVLHFAGLTDFEPDPLTALAVNTHGGEYAADLAARTASARFLHVSTAFVAGNVSGEIPEDIEAGLSPNGTRFDPQEEIWSLDRLCQRLDTRRARVDAAMEHARRLGWPNIYTFSKGLSEHLHASRDDLRLSILRPAVVESAVAYPFAGWNEGINTSGPLVWLLSSWFRQFPSKPAHRFDVVPVDTVARGILSVLAASLRDEAERVYHLGSSATNPLTFERAIDLTALATRRMHSKPETAPLDRLLVRYLDAVPRGAGSDPFPSLETLRWGARRMREVLKGVRTEGRIPPEAHRRWGARLDERFRSLSMDFRKADRTIAGIEDMLRSYQPFIHDNDYTFRTEHIQALNAGLRGEERELFRFDIDDLCWRTYWLDVHVPGLEKWSLPLLRGEKVPDDPAPPAPRTPRQVPASSRRATTGAPGKAGTRPIAAIHMREGEQ